MAEGWMRALGGERYEVSSAGTEPRGIHPLAVAAMREVDVDISGQQSDHIDQYLKDPLDLVVTVCDRAQEVCPVFDQKTRILHWSFDDPASAVGTDEEKMIVFRRVRDEICDQISRYLAEEVGNGKV